MLAETNTSEALGALIRKVARLSGLTSGETMGSGRSPPESWAYATAAIEANRNTRFMLSYPQKEQHYVRRRRHRHPDPHRLAKSYWSRLGEESLQEAGIPFFTMDQNIAARQESGNFLGWWSVRVPREREAEAREILLSVEEMK